MAKGILWQFEYKVGDWVEVGPSTDPFPGQVTGCCLEADGHVTYRVAWWSGRTRSNEWLSREEIRPLPEKVGLRNG